MGTEGRIRAGFRPNKTLRFSHVVLQESRKTPEAHRYGAQSSIHCMYGRRLQAPGSIRAVCRSSAKGGMAICRPPNRTRLPCRSGGRLRFFPTGVVLRQPEQDSTFTGDGLPWMSVDHNRTQPPIGRPDAEPGGHPRHTTGARRR